MSLGMTRSFDNRSMLRVTDFDASLAVLSDASAVHAYCNRRRHRVTAPDNLVAL